jgi:hypothetical protein
MSQKKGGILVVGTGQKTGSYLATVIAKLCVNLPQPGTINHFAIAHDVWCDLLKGAGPCNCSPEVRNLGSEQ